MNLPTERVSPEENEQCDFADELHQLRLSEMEMDWDDREVA